MITEKTNKVAVVSAQTLLRRVITELNRVRKIETDDPKDSFARAKTIGYLTSVASQILAQHEMEKRIERLENLMKERNDQND